MLHEEAEPLLLDAYAKVRPGGVGSEVLSYLAELYDAWGKPEKAAEYRALLPDAEESGASD